ncbi:hypothetical protein TrLO_g11409 [Triparma laevis f. longispina]|uniref:Uncharacterized protein n=1 Tax=Triparma laevis f. longispina TaxID=1714387 RepID=A0A9W7C5X8_9STRA|nr:hypothetical protein TrLO_g11409 [Triparma laevis f. longispina]
MIRFFESHECFLENENDAKCDNKEIFDSETSIKCLTISYKTSSLSPSSIFTTLLPKLIQKLPYNNFYYLNNPLKQLNLQNSLLPNFKIEEDPFSKSLLDKHGSYIDEADLSSYFFKIKTPNEISVEDVIKKCSSGCEVSWWHEGCIYTGRAFGHKGEGGCVILGDSNALRIAKKVGIRCVVPDDINRESVLGLVRWLSFGEVDQGLEFEEGGGWRVVKDDIVEEEEVEKNDKKDGDKKDGEKKTEKGNKWKPKYKLGDEVIYGEENTLSTITAVMHSSKTYTLSSKTTIIMSTTSKSKNIVDNIPEKDLSRFTPKPVHLIVNSQVTSKFALNFTQKHGHKNNSSNHTLSDDRYISSLIFVSHLLPSLILLDSLPTPIQIHDGTSAQKKYLSRKSKEFTKFGQRLKIQPRFTFFMPKVDFETGRFLLKYQDQVEEELAPIKTQPLFQVFTDCPGMNTTLNRIKAFLSSSTKATTPAPENPEKIDSEALQIAKRSNIIPIVLMTAGTSLAMCNGIVSSKLTHASVNFAKSVVDHKASFSGIGDLAMNLLFLTGCESAISIPQRKMIRKGSDIIVKELKEDCFRQMLVQEVSYAEKKTADNLLSVLNNDTSAVADFLTKRIPEAVDAISQVVGAVMTIKHYSPPLLILSTLQGLVKIEMYTNAWRLYSWLRREPKSLKSKKKKVEDSSGEILRNFKAVRTFNRQDIAMTDYKNWLYNMSSKNGKSNVKNLLKDIMYPMMWLFTESMKLAMKVYAGQLVISGRLDEKIVDTVLSNGSELTWRLWWVKYELFGSDWDDDEDDTWVDSGARILVLLDREPPIQLKKGIRDVEIRGDIEFKGVDFSYTNSEDDLVLEDVNLKIAAGSKVGLVGPSGGGKSTTIALIQRFYDPFKGTITLDGRDLRDYAPDFLSQKMSVVSQEAVVFSTSIKNNVLWGKPDATDHEIEVALKRACLWNDVTKLVLGLETSATNLSGGQKQRLTIARAIVSNPTILLLDEATAALDTKSEKSVQQALNNLMSAKTVIAIAHRLSTIMDSTKIAVIDDKTVIEEGTHIGLMQKEDGKYAELCKLSGMSGDSSCEGSENGLKKALEILELEYSRNPDSEGIEKTLKEVKSAKRYFDIRCKALDDEKKVYTSVLKRYDDDEGNAIDLAVEVRRKLAERNLDRIKAISKIKSWLSKKLKGCRATK